MNETLEIKDLVVDRGGREVLHSISMSLPQGEITALLGANGAGKSSLVMTIGGNVPARSGDILHNGVNLVGLKPHVVRARGVCVVAEGHQVLFGLTVEDNLRAAAMMHPASQVDAEIAKVMAIFPELTERLNVNAENLSGGQKQMVNIAQALIARPRFLLIDELSFGLAPAIVSRLGNVIREIAALGVGVLLIEQFTSLALKVSSRAYVMERGRLVFDGTSAELAANPAVLHGAYLASQSATSAGSLIETGQIS